ncbi:MAG: mechanosensitive ion channel family protein [Balneolaceae bacterium]|nr:mechanosensitive ion channel family protein [Balneolaceae bacterium]
MDTFDYLISPDFLALLARLALLLAVSLPALALIRRSARAFCSRKYSPHYGMLAGKVVWYTGLTLIAITVMSQLGISLAPMLGAAGIVGIALGFASQTSVSNIISGMFLIAEQPFKVDDIITVNNQTGIVLSIDVLSVKLRTFDNQFVRIPNETIIKTEVINLTRFPIRRFSAKVSVAYKEDIGRVRDVLMDVAEKNDFALSEPEPHILFDTFGASSIDLFLRVWAPSEDYLLLRNSIQEEVKARFDEEGIEIPFPHVSLYSGAATRALPIQLVQPQGNDAEEAGRPRPTPSDPGD